MIPADPGFGPRARRAVPAEGGRSRGAEEGHIDGTERIMSAAAIGTPRRIWLRVGLVVASAIAVIELVGTLVGLADSEGIGLAIGVVTAVLAVATLALAPLAWRGRRGPAIGVAATRVVASLAGLPAFFLPEVPPAGVIAAATGIVLAAGVAICVLTTDWNQS